MGRPVQEHWYDQFSAKLNLQILKGSVKKKTEQVRDNYQPDACNVYVINYESVWREPFFSWAVKNGPWSMIVLDESHRAKSPGSRVSKSLYRLGLRSYKRVAMSGTMMDENPLDVYGQYRFLDVGIFGSKWTRFRDQYAIMGGFQGRQIVGHKNQQELMIKVDSVCLRVTEEEAESFDQLPQPIHITRKCQLTGKAKDLYRSVDRK